MLSIGLNRLWHFNIVLDGNKNLGGYHEAFPRPIARLTLSTDFACATILAVLVLFFATTARAQTNDSGQDDAGFYLPFVGIGHNDMAYRDLMNEGHLRHNGQENGVPVLSGLPFIGGLFRNVGTGRNIQRLLILVTPRIVKSEE